MVLSSVRTAHLPKVASVKAIDLGLESYIVDQDGEKLSPPKFLAKLLDRVKRASQALSRKVKGSKNRAKARRSLLKVLLWLWAVVYTRGLYDGLLRTTMPSRDTASLYYKAGTSDKVYHVQLEPSGTEWVVNVQYGRRVASSLRDETKTPVATTYAAAKAIYDDLLSEKKKKGYLSGPLTGKSLPKAMPTPAPLSLSSLPSWDGFEDFYSEAATALGEPSTLKTAPQPHLVLLADIASGMQEGASDAVASIKRLKSGSGVRALLSREGQNWLDSLDVGLNGTCEATLWMACKRVS